MIIRCTLLLLLMLSLATSSLYAVDLDANGVSTDLPSDPNACPAGCVAAPAADPSLWSRSLTLGFSYTDGNSNTGVLNVSSAASRDYNDNIWKFLAAYNYAESDSDTSEERDTTNNQLLAETTYKRIFNESYFGGLGFNYKYDEIADIDYRIITNPLIGAFLLRGDNTKLSVEIGPSYLYERVGNVEDDYLAPRIADSFEWTFSETGKLFQSFEILFDSTESENYLINAEAGVESSLSSLLSLVLVIRDAYDNQPADGRQRNDVAVITSLKVNL